MLTFDGRAIPIAPGQTVLAALDAADVPLDRGCRAGICQSCLVRAVEGKVPAAAQEGLSEAQKAQGFLLACVCVPEEPLRILRKAETGNDVAVLLRALDRLSPSVVRLRLEPNGPFSYRPGQFINLKAGDGILRSYSIASHPGEDPFVELHIRLIPGGRMSGLVAAHLAPGDELTITGPYGTCCYDGVGPDQPLVLAGTGTGLAPLFGILRDALRHGHRGPIRLYHGALDRSGLYLVGELAEMAAAHENFTYIPCIRNEPGGPSGDLVEVVVADEEAPDAASFYLCGDPDLVARMKRTLFLKGARLDRLHADPFLPAEPR